MKRKKNAIFAKKSFVIIKIKKKIKLYKKVRDHCHYTEKVRGSALSIWNLRYKLPKIIPIVIYNAGYDTHFIIKHLPEELGSKFECLGESTEKYITFLVPI